MEFLIRFRNQYHRYAYRLKKNGYYALLILILAIGITFINDMYIRVHFIEYNAVLRLVDHLVAGISIPLILTLLFGSLYKRCVFYFLWSSVWEIQQFLQRGYFQFEQYSFDLLGIGIAIFFYKRVLSSKKISYQLI